MIEEVKEIQHVSIQEALNNAQTIEECMKFSEYFIKVSFSFMKKAESIKLNEDNLVVENTAQA